jgi:hypothetical protein
MDQWRASNDDLGRWFVHIEWCRAGDRTHRDHFSRWLASHLSRDRQSVGCRAWRSISGGANFGESLISEASISGTIFVDRNNNGVRDAGDKGIVNAQVYIDVNNNSQLDADELSLLTSDDQFYTPTLDEAGTYSFTHLPQGTYVIRMIVPTTLSATPATELVHEVILGAGEAKTDINALAVYRANEIHGVKFEDLDGNHVRDDGEPGMAGLTIFIDSNRNGQHDVDEPTTTTGEDGTYDFFGLTPGSYVVREIVEPGYIQTSPETVSGTLWPEGTSNPAIGNVSPTSITESLQEDESYRTIVSLTLPESNALTNVVDVFLLFDDTGSFVYNSPIVRSAFPSIITDLQAALPGIDLGFGVGRFEEYGSFASEYATGRPFILNQPVIAASTPGYMDSIQSALNRTTPGYGGDGPETDIEALYQLVTGRGFDGNDNGTTSDSGAAGLAATQITPGNSGDVPSFASFVADPASGVMAAAGNVGGGGFRSGALPIILLATDIGVAYQPKGETSIAGVSGTTLPLSSLTQSSRSTTPFNSGAGIQETITALNALGALVIGLGTNAGAGIDPRQQLESISTLTGAVNRTATTIENGTTDPIAPGDPLYFQIASGFSASVANGIRSAIQNAVTTVAVDIDVRASDPRVHLINHTGILMGVEAGQTVSFDVEFIGDGSPRRFDLEFVRAGTNVVLGSIPVVLGTDIEGDGYHHEELEDGDFSSSLAFSDRIATGGPTDIWLDVDLIAENLSPLSARAVGNLSSADPDVGDTHTYLLASSTGVNDNALFEIVGTELRIQSGVEIDYEVRPSYVVNVRSTDSTGIAFEKEITIMVANLAEVDQIVLNDGTSQRSRVTSVDVAFDGVVTIGENAFAVTKHGEAAGDVAVTVTTQEVAGRTIATLAFSGPFVEAGSLVDGSYSLTIFGNLILDGSGAALDGDRDGTAGGDRLFGETEVDHFYRFYGDQSGDRTVSLLEFNQFRNTFGKAAGSAGYSSEFDFDDNGVIGLSDFSPFRARFGRTLPFE